MMCPAMKMSLILTVVLGNVLFVELMVISNFNRQENETGRLKDFLGTVIGNERNNVLVTPRHISYRLERNLEGLVLYRMAQLCLETFLEKLTVKPAAYIIIFDEANGVNNTFDVITTSAAYSSHSMLLILIEDKELLPTIAELIWSFKLIRSYILLATNDNIEVHRVELIDCGPLVKTRLASSFSWFNSSFIVPRIDLRLILKGCPIYLITSHQPPYTNPENDTVKGILIEMIEVFCVVAQREFVFRPYESIYMDEIVESYSFTAMVERFESGYADLYLGPLVITAIDVVDISPFLLSDDLMFLVPRAFITGSLDMLYAPSNVLRLGAFAIGIGLVAVTFNLMVRYTVDRDIFGNVLKTFLIFFGLILNVPTLPRFPANTKIKLLLVGMLYLIMVFTSYIQGVFISILNGPYYEPPIKGLRELLEKNIPIKLYATLAFFFEYTDSEYYKDIVERHTRLNEKDLFNTGNVLLKEKDFATVIYRGYILMRPNIEKSFSIFKVYSNAIVVGMPKNYYMHKEFFEWFTQMVEHGIMIKYVKLYEFIYALQYYVETESRLFKLTMEQIGPLFLILINGYLYAFLAFIMELLWHALKNRLQRRKAHY